MTDNSIIEDKILKDNEGVSDSQLLMDIKRTEMEVEAYKQIYDGYMVLAKLTENEGLTSSVYSKAQLVGQLESECRSFLEKLYMLKRLRGLE